MSTQYFVSKLKFVIIPIGFTLPIAAILAVVAWLLINNYFPLSEATDVKAKYLAQYVVVAQVILIGFFVTLAAVIIQAMLPEARDQFEQYKESRRAYSQAKTAVLYLPDRVLNTNDKEQQFALITQAHEALHSAEMFEDIIISKGYLHWFENPHLWILYNYWQITAVVVALRANIVQSGNNETLREKLQSTLDEVHERFGKRGRGEGCKGERWVLETEEQHDHDVRIRYDEEDALLAKINDAAGYSV